MILTIIYIYLITTLICLTFTISFFYLYVKKVDPYYFEDYREDLIFFIKFSLIPVLNLWVIIGFIVEIYRDNKDNLWKKKKK